MRSVGQPLGAIGAAVALVFAAPVAALTPAAQSDSVQSAERSVVRVVTVSLDAVGQPIGMDTGSGFAVAPGLVVTNRHMVVGSAQAVETETFVIPEADAGGQSARAQVKQTWSDADLALLTVPGLTSPPLTIAMTPPNKEATVRALGYPGVTDELRNLPLSEILRPQETYVTAGSIALFSKVAPGGGRIDTIFHTAPINPGNSGGPLIDACGRVVGVNTWGAGAELSADGQMTTPQGQFIATQSDVLAKFLADAQVKALLANGPCVPASVQTLQDRLKADETAIASQRDEISKVQAQLANEQGREKRLSTTISLVAAALGLPVLVLLAMVFRPKRRLKPAELARTSAEGPEHAQQRGGPEAPERV